jgi:MATE family multidrug resistance protein
MEASLVEDFYIFFLFCNLCFAGVAVGAGRQSMVAYINIGCYFLIGVPVGALLGYVADLGIKVRRFLFF